MIKKYPYLSDVNFLNKIYGQHNRTNYVLITSLDWNERPIKEVQGKITAGTININGDSSVRRTANLSIKVLDDDSNYLDLNNLFAINKKIFIETGFNNGFTHLGDSYYSSYPIIWFPFGTFIIQTYSITHDSSGIMINLTLGDKMCLLNGTAGGTIPASTNFESYDTLGPDGDLHTEFIRINQLIPELVNHFGKEDLNKIIVNDIDDKIKKVMRWTGVNPLFLWLNNSDKRNVFYTTINGSPENLGLSSSDWTRRQILFNYDAGYTYVDFVYPGELTGAAGDSVCTILDKIKNTLGNYEYYYDVFGNFIFQEIKNYVNVSEWRTYYQDALKDNDGHLDYRYEPRLDTAVYNFNDSKFVISYNNSPKFEMIKNDFIVWGVRKGTDNTSYPCCYHLAIDKRPVLTEDYSNPIPICFDTSVDDRIKRCYDIKGIYTDLATLKEKHPQGIVGEYYYINNATEGGVYTWISDIARYNTLLNNLKSAGTPVSSSDNSYISAEVNAGYVKMELATYYPAGAFTIPGPDENDNPQTNWRNILYFQGVFQAAQGLDTNYYWAELYNEWPKIYDIENNDWYEGVLDSPSSLDWWLDLIDNDAELNKFSVDAIGRRSYAKTDSQCNCVFEPDIPDIIMVNVGNREDLIDSRSAMTQQQLTELGLIPTQVSEAVYESVIEGGIFNSCYQHIRQILTDYTSYNESISLTCLPIYHLEPNTRVFFNDPEIGIYGDYIINTISYTLGNTGTMTINAKKCIEKI